MDSDIQLSLWGVIIILGAFHGIFISIGLLTKDENKLANKLFAGLLIVVSYNLFEYAFAISHMYAIFPHLIATSYPFLFLMGPLYFFYIKKLTDAQFSVGRGTWWHFIPAITCLLLLMPFYLSSGNAKIEFLMAEVAGNQGHVEIPWGQYLFMTAHFVQTFIYLLVSKRVLVKKEAFLKSNLSDNRIIQFSFLHRMTATFFWFLVVCLVVLGLLPIVRQYRVKMDYVLVLTMSALVHLTGYVALRQPLLIADDLLTSVKEKYANYRLTDGQLGDLYQKIVARVEEKELYLISDYKISDLSDALEVPVHYLSQAINEQGGNNFFEFINAFRVERARQLLSKSDDSYMKIMTVAFDSGFNNKATFNRIFKKHTGYTPSQYKARTSDD